jgi:nickel-dependent lactate racemase
MLTALSYRIQIDLPTVTFDIPADTDILTVPTPPPPLVDPAGAIARALQAPIGIPSLAQIRATACPEKAPADKPATVVVSDSTRPDVLYTGTTSILHPLLGTREAQGLLPQHSTILVATGTHRASTPAEQLQMFGADVVQRYAIADHCATAPGMLRYIGRTASDTEVSINTHYRDADITILTGEIKPHFLAGFSGGHAGLIC